MGHTNEQDYNKNPTLSKVLKPDNDLKSMLVEYVGEKLNPKNKNITVEMIVEVMATEFPDFLLAVAEENFLRGYEQALEDVDTGINLKLSEKDIYGNRKKKNCKLCEKEK